jgi:ABC-type antimicrobial peptide transport system permease subunit
MKLTTRFAWTQIKRTRSRTIWTLAGIVLATMMITAVFGFAESALRGIYDFYVQEDGDWHLQFQWIDEETAIGVAGVFAVTWVTMRYSASRLKGRSIVDAIRAEGGI